MVNGVTKRQLHHYDPFSLSEKRAELIDTVTGTANPSKPAWSSCLLFAKPGGTVPFEFVLNTE